MLPLLLALLPLDLIDPSAVSNANDLRLDAIVQAQRVSAELTNASKRPVRVFLGYSCSGPEPFQVIIDGVSRPFVSTPVECGKNVSRVEVLAPGERRRISSDIALLDGAGHNVAVSYTPRNGYDHTWRGAIMSPVITVSGGTLCIELIAKPGPILDGARVSIDIVHHWQGPTPIRVHKGWAGVCGGPLDQLFVDGAPRPFTQHVNCDQPPPIDVEVLHPGGSWTTHGSIVVAPGHHRLRARYSIDPRQAAAAHRADNMDVYVGSVESPEVTLPF